jgi:hypothetical protein
MALPAVEPAAIRVVNCGSTLRRAARHLRRPEARATTFVTDCCPSHQQCRPKTPRHYAAAGHPPGNGVLPFFLF